LMFLLVTNLPSLPAKGEVFTCTHKHQATRLTSLAFERFGSNSLRTRDAK
jgi:hypothetical protein